MESLWRTARSQTHVDYMDLGRVSTILALQIIFVLLGTDCCSNHSAFLYEGNRQLQLWLPAEQARQVHHACSCSSHQTEKLLEHRSPPLQFSKGGNTHIRETIVIPLLYVNYNLEMSCIRYKKCICDYFIRKGLLSLKM